MCVSLCKDVEASIDGIIAKLPTRDARLACLERLYRDLEHAKASLPHMLAEHVFIMENAEALKKKDMSR
jgi:hypothetical protein